MQSFLGSVSTAPAAAQMAKIGSALTGVEPGEVQSQIACVVNCKLSGSSELAMQGLGVRYTDETQHFQSTPTGGHFAKSALLCWTL